MKPKAVVLREAAQQDVEDAIAYLIDEGAPAAAANFIDALEQALEHVSRHPSTGSPRYAHELNLPDLRAWPLRRHRHLVFYVEHTTHVDVWRVLHGRRDIPAWLQSREEAPDAEPDADEAAATPPAAPRGARRRGARGAR